MGVTTFSRGLILLASAAVSLASLADNTTLNANTTLTDNTKIERPALINQCEKCHGLQGKAGMPGWPDIAGQSKASLVAKLKSYRSQIVPDSVMSRGVHDLTDAQIERLASYYTQLKNNPEKSPFP